MLEGHLPKAGLLFTDLEGSTQHLRTLGDNYGQSLDRHHELLRTAVEAEEGVEVGSEGDSLAVVFPSVTRALLAAVAAQRALAAEPWPDSPWRVRMAVHTGAVSITEARAVGLSLHEAARIRNVGHGGQILVSARARDAIDEALPADLRLLDLGLHDVRDVGRAVPLLQVVTPDLAGQHPPLRTGSSRGVPQSLTTFVGRQAEIAEVFVLLGRRRLVTIVGPGGSGKTRLAYEVAGRSPIESIAVVELAALTDAAQVRPAVATAVGAAEPDAIDIAVGDRPLLLVLDNCEHLLEAAAGLLAPLLTACPELRVLATSREPLLVSGETVWTVPRLAIDERMTLVQARSSRPIDDLGALRSICERLDGIPLALELAAARLRSLPIEELAKRIDDQLGVLTGGARDTPRQQTLRATLDWSHDLLADEDRIALRRLAVFAGGFTLDAAESVLAGPSAFDALAALDSLVAKSLVELTPTGRFAMLEPVRQYAQERLAAAGEVETVRDAHLLWVARFGAQAGRELFTDQTRWTARLDAESPNVATAINWACEHDLETAAELVSNLAQYWFTGQRHDSEVWILRVLDQIDDLSQKGKAKALLGAGIVFCDNLADGRPPDWLAEAVAHFRALGRERGLAGALFWLGRSLGVRQRLEEMRPVVEESVEVHHRLGDEFGWGWSRLWLGLTAWTLDGDTAAAEAIIEEVLARGHETGVPHLVGAALGGLSQIAYETGRDDEAVRLVSDAIDVFEVVGDRWQRAIHLCFHAFYRLSEGPEAAVPDLLAALDAFEALGASSNIMWALGCAAVVLDESGEPEHAAVLAGAVEDNVPIMDANTFLRLNESRRRIEAIIADPAFAERVAEGRRLGLWRAAPLARQWLTELQGS